MSLREQLERIRRRPIPNSEESAKNYIIKPILRNLDWDPDDPAEVLYEHRVGDKGDGRVDMALRSSGSIVALIEAKAPGHSLGSYVNQVLNYAFVGEGDICVLTTGMEWWLYLPRESGSAQERRFAILRVEHDPIEQLMANFGAFLSKEALVSGDAKKQATLVLKELLETEQLKKELPTIWKGMVDEPDDDLVELLSMRVYERLNRQPTRTQVAAALQGLPIPSADIPTEPPEAPPSPPPPQPPGKRRKPHPPTKMVLWGKSREVTTSREVLLAVADALYKRHPADEFSRILEVRGRKLPTAARDPNTLGTDNYRQVGASGIFISVHMSADHAIVRAKKYLEHFGHSASDLEVFYD